jgi:DNA polymerase III sliding clamp (beta) subunit (PCNA family)
MLIQRKELFRILESFKKGVDKCNEFPYNHIKLDFHPEGLKLSIMHKNQECILSSILKGSTSLKTTVYVLFNSLYDVIKNLNDNDIILTYSDFIRIHGKETNTIVRLVVSEEFPLVYPSEKNNNIFPVAVDRREFLKGLEVANTSKARYETGYILCGVLFDTLTLAGTDGNRLHEHKICLKKEHKGHIIKIIPGCIVETLIKIIKLDKTSENVYFKDNNDRIIFYINGIEVNTGLIRGKYPNYPGLIPSQNKLKKLVLNTKMFKSNIKKVSVLANDRVNTITLAGNKNKNLKIYANTPGLGHICITEPCKDALCMDMDLNYKFVLDVLRLYKDSEEIELYYGGDLKPLLIKQKGENSSMCLIMPQQRVNKINNHIVQ